MRIAFLCKRKYMSKDVIVDKYARLYEIPFQLARLGHTVHGYCLSYQGHDAGVWEHDAKPGTLVWESRSLGRTYLPSLARYPAHVFRKVREFAPDIVIGASDIPHVALSAWIAKRLQIPYVADLYDNFEGFGQARIPGMIPLLRRAVRNADLVTTTSEPLKDLVIEAYRAHGQVMAMPSTIDKSIFYIRDRNDSRIELGLPEHAPLIGTAGGLSTDKGVQALYAAWEIIQVVRPDVHLVLAGPVDPNVPLPGGDRVHYLGMLPHPQTATLFNTLNVGAICIRDTAFGRYCFPQKAYEMLACGLPVVAARIGAMVPLLANFPECTFQPEDPKDLARVILKQLERPTQAHVPIEDWSELIARMETALRAIC